MSRALVSSYVLDRDNYLSGAKLAYDYELRNSRKRYFGFLIIGLVQFGVVMALKKGAIGLLLISSILLIYWYLLRWPLRKLLLLNVFNKLPLKDEVIAIEFNNEGININKNSILWSDIQRVLLENEGFLLYYHNNYIFIPKKSFDKDSEEEFLKIIKKKLKTNILDDRRN